MLDLSLALSLPCSIPDSTSQPLSYHIIWSMPGGQCRMVSEGSFFCPLLFHFGTNWMNKTRTITNYELFKDTLLRNINDNPLFFIGSRQEQIIVAKLRMQCSYSNGHLYSMKIIDSPACSCGFVNKMNFISYYFVLCIIDLESQTKMLWGT